jgi:hypothetical protein
MYQQPLMRRTVMLPLNRGQSALKEKRIPVGNGIVFSDAATQVGDKNKAFADTMLLDDEIGLHTVNAEDPGSSTLNFADSADLNMVRVRGIEHADILSQHVHVSLDGHSPHTGIETSKAAMTINIGQPVYPDSGTTVSLANADIGGIPVLGMPIGLALTDATANQVILIATEGSVEQDDWTLVTGSALLTPGAIYFLDGPTAGKLTETALTTDGYMGIRVGRALTTIKMDIEISDGVIL